MLRLDLKNKALDGKTILKDLQIHLEHGDRLAVLGPSGIGKTTLLRIIAGLDQDFDGELHAPTHIALMFQNPNLLPWCNLYNNLAVFHPRKSEDEIHNALDEVGLLEKAKTYPKQLSLGQQRRLALAVTFLGHSDLVLLDEAFVSLDVSLKLEMIALVEKLLKNSSLILVTHSIDEAEALGCKIIKLS